MYAFATANDGSRYPVSAVLIADADRDLAVIRVDGGGRQFPCLPMRGAGAVTTGDVVYAIGSPLGLSNSISDGIVANRSRLVPQAGSPDPYIQVTAAISPGSSGGALINEYGEAIGITTATFAYGQNLNLAVPLDLALTDRGRLVLPLCAGRRHRGCAGKLLHGHDRVGLYLRLRHGHKHHGLHSQRWRLHRLWQRVHGGW